MGNQIDILTYLSIQSRTNRILCLRLGRSGCHIEISVCLFACLFVIVIITEDIQLTSQTLTGAYGP